MNAKTQIKIYMHIYANPFKPSNPIKNLMANEIQNSLDMYYAIYVKRNFKRRILDEI
jgi:hypothetical protein